jgi:hypothetical protein
MTDKYVWAKSVETDKRISPLHRLILNHCGIHCVYGTDDAFCIRQQTVADHFEVRRQTVGAALMAGRRFGWLETTERQRGRGWHQGDGHRLTIPDEIGARPQTYFDEIGARPQTYSGEKYVRGGDEIGAPLQTYSGEIGARRRTEYVRGGVSNNASTSTNDAPMVTEMVTEQENMVVAHGFTKGGFGQRAVAIVEEFVCGQLRKGSAKKVLVGAIGEALRTGMDEDLVLGVLEEWLSTPGAASYDFCRMLNKARDAMVAAEMVDDNQPAPQGVFNTGPQA